MDGKRDLVSEYRQSAIEYLQWLEAAKDRFEEVPGIGDRLAEMYGRGNLYGWMSQKGLYDYRVKLDPEIWRELQRRWQDDWETLARLAEELSPADRAEWDKLAARMVQYHEELTKAAEDWFFKETMRKSRGAGCGLWLFILGAAPMIGWYFHASFLV